MHDRNSGQAGILMSTTHLTDARNEDSQSHNGGEHRLAHRARRHVLRATGVLGLVAVLYTTPSHAGWFDDHISHPLGNGIVNLGDAAAQVATAGEIGRRRDKERAEAAAAQAAIQAAAAQKQRADKIASTNAQIEILNHVVTSFDANLTTANDVWSLYDKIIEVGQTELGTRARVQADAERALDENRKSQAELAGLNDAIVSLNALGQQLASAATSQQSAQEVSAQNLDIAKQLLRTADLDNSSNGLYLNRALHSLKTDGLRGLVSQSIEARTLVAGLRSNLAEQKKSYSEQLDGKRKELATLQPA